MLTLVLINAKVLVVKCQGILFNVYYSFQSWKSKYQDIQDILKSYRFQVENSLIIQE